MKKLFTFNLSLFILGGLMLLNSCKGKDGAPGAAGPAGNANVTSVSITIHPSDWTWLSTYNQWAFSYYCNEPMNTAVYGYVISGNGEEAMPYYSQIDGTTTSFATDLFQTTPYIMIEYYALSSSLAAPAYDTYVYLVFVPPAAISKHPNLNWKNYEEVKKAFNLHD